jgi:hypothetical protein
VKVALVVAAVVLLLALSACGGGSARLSKQQYERKVHAIAASIGKSVADSVPKSGHLNIVAYQQRLARAFAAAAASLRRLRPPTDAAADNAKIAAGLAFLAETLRTARGDGGAALSRTVVRSKKLRALAAAEADLERKGYEFHQGFHFPHGASPPTPPGSPLARPVRAISFALVSRSGRQQATDRHATFCPPHPGSSSCSFEGHLVPSTGPVPGALSVVRPGEHVQIAAGKPIEFVTGFASRLCSGSLYFGKGSSLDGRDWTIRLAPGRYVVGVSFTLPSGSGQTSEDGLVGLLVSKTMPFGIVRHPSC